MDARRSSNRTSNGEEHVNGRRYMNLVFKLDMCTCGGGACDEIVSTFFCFRNQKRRKKTLIIHLFFSLSYRMRASSFHGKRSIKSLSLFDIDFPSLSAPFDSQKPDTGRQKKLFAQHKNVFYHCTKYLVIKRRNLCHRKCV